MENELNYFCEDCNSGPYCPECIIQGLHKDHRIISLKNFADSIKSKMSTRIIECDKAISILEGRSEQIENEKTRLCAEGVRIKDQIKSQIADFERIIEQKKEIITQYVDRMVQGCISKLKFNTEDIWNEKSRLTQYRKQLENFVFSDNSVALVEFYLNKFESIPKINIPNTNSQVLCILDSSSQEGLKEFLEWIKRTSKELTEFPSLASRTSTPITQREPSKSEIEHKEEMSTQRNPRLERLAKILEGTLSSTYKKEGSWIHKNSSYRKHMELKNNLFLY